MRKMETATNFNTSSNIALALILVCNYYIALAVIAALCQGDGIIIQVDFLIVWQTMVMTNISIELLSFMFRVAVHLSGRIH